MADDPMLSPHPSLIDHDAPEEKKAKPATNSAVKDIKLYRMTPLPMKQMVPMTFVLLSESICQCMIVPFAGFFVAHLQNVPLDEAGYSTGFVASCFMLGQVVSSKVWGRVSDIYGRKFPLVSGLFTSGLLMLGFGLSTNVWMAAFFRFCHGLFNGNILVAKTMMADITDKTNEAVGFSFVSFCYGIGVLIGSGLGGFLYEPHWFGDDSLVVRHPALMPSLFIFVYTTVGMAVCTWFVQESNLKAKPLPFFVKLIYPCMLKKTEFYEKPPMRLRDEAGEEGGVTVENGDRARMSGSFAGRSSSSSDTEALSELVENLSVTFPVGSIVNMSGAPLLEREVRELDRRMVKEAIRIDLEEELPTTPAASAGDEQRRGGDEREITSRAASRHSSRRASRTSSPVSPSEPQPNNGDNGDIGDGVELNDYTLTGSFLGASAGGVGLASLANSFASVRTGAGPARGRLSANNSFASAASATAAVSVPGTAGAGGEEPVYKSFGYKQAFAIPRTRFMLIMFMLLCAGDMCLQEIFPLWCMASAGKGGGSLSHTTVGMLLLTNSIPCITSNLCFPMACRRWHNKMSLFRLATFLISIAVVVLPITTSGLLGTLPMWLFLTVVVLCLAWRQFFASWCYGLVTMVTARAAPAGHVGSMLGINQSCGALTRGLAPLFADPLFAWSISGNHIFPFNYFLLFFASAGFFLTASWCSHMYRTNDEGLLERTKKRLRQSANNGQTT